MVPVASHEDESAPCAKMAAETLAHIPDKLRLRIEIEYYFYKTVSGADACVHLFQQCINGNGTGRFNGGALCFKGAHLYFILFDVGLIDKIQTPRGCVKRNKKLIKIHLG